MHHVIARCDHVKVLATSREPLGVAGERVWRVPSLDVASDAVELFCDRAADGDSSFDRVGHEAVLAQICQRLDGIPLAIELAAARIRSLTPDELLVRLQDRFRLLRGSGRGTLERHQTLRSTVSWSYQLLTDAERLLFDRLSVFAGDRRGPPKRCRAKPLDAAMLDLVHSLVDKSMVLASAHRRGRASDCRKRFASSARSSSVRHDDHCVAISTITPNVSTNSTSWCARQIEGTQVSQGVGQRARAPITLACAISASPNALAPSTTRSARRVTKRRMGATNQRLGETVGRPSLTLGVYAHWLNVQADEAKALHTARRGIEVAPALDDPSTVECWFMLFGASPLVSATSTAARDAFQCFQAAVANVADLDSDWWPLVNLVDAALAVEPLAFDRYRQRLSAVAARVQAPQLVTYALLYEGHAYYSTHRRPTARRRGLLQHAVKVAAAAGDGSFGPSPRR